MFKRVKREVFRFLSKEKEKRNLLLSVVLATSGFIAVTGMVTGIATAQTHDTSVVFLWVSACFMVISTNIKDWFIENEALKHKGEKK